MYAKVYIYLAIKIIKARIILKLAAINMYMINGWSDVQY